MDTLSTDGNEGHDIVHQVGGQSSGPPIPGSLASDGMDARPKSISADRQDVGPTHSGPIRIQDQHSAPAVLLVEVESTSTSNKRTHSVLDSGERFCQPTMGPHLTVSGEDTEGTVNNHSGDSLLAISDMVSNPTEPCCRVIRYDRSTLRVIDRLLALGRSLSSPK
ncbi:hypothetical protein BGZ88_005108 [Linnemannia elongata]|nr:hypothetical protein BGZ88_005108 [Linnemannia elongata]